MTGQKDEIAKWVADLADADPSAREASALRLHSAGVALVSPILNEWLKDPELRELMRSLSTDNQGKPNPAYTVGIAVEPHHFERIRAANGSPRLSEVPPDQDAKEFELRFADSCHFDILTTRQPGGAGAIARFLQKLGEGIQQIEVNVTDVDRATDILRTRFGVAPIYSATRPGADGTRVNFFLVSVAEGKKCLVELVEPSGGT